MPVQDIRIRFDSDARDIQTAIGLMDKLNDKEKELVSTLGKVTSETNKAEKSLQSQGKSLDSIGNVAGKLGGVLAGAFAVDRVVSFGKQIIETTSQFQKLNAVLTNALGSESAGQVAFAKIQDFAAKTNFSVLELTESFVKLKGAGFEPTTAELTKLADLANSKAKSFDQLAEAIIDAQTGEFERLKEFGVLASKAGDQVTFTFNEQKTVVRNTASEIRKYITGLGELQGVTGSTAAISATLGGQLSNLEDSFDSLYNAIGSRGDSVIGGFINLISEGVKKLTEMVTSMEDLAKQKALLELSKDSQAFAAGIQESIDKQIALGLTADEAAAKVKKSFTFEYVSEANQEIPKLQEKIKALSDQISQTENNLGVIDTLQDITDYGTRIISGGLADLQTQRDKIKELRVQKTELEGQQKIFEERIKLIGDIGKKTKETTELTDAQKKAAEDLKKELERLRAEYIRIVEAAERNNRSALENIIFDFEKTTKKLSELGVKLGIDKEKLDKDLQQVTKSFEKDFREALDKIGVIDAIVPFEKTKEQLEKEKQLRDKFNDDRIRKTTEASEEEVEIQRAESEKKRKIWKEEQAYRQMVTKESMELLTNLGNAFFEIQQGRYVNDLAAVQQTEQTKLAIVGDNEQAQAFIREEAARKELEIRRKQARAEKAQALFNIAINTAEAIAKAIATFPFPANLIPIGFAVAQGAIQAAVVTSRPLPQFKHGVLNLQGPGSETSDSILARLSRGESVMTARETKSFLPTLKAIREGSISPRLLNEMATAKVPNGYMVQSPEYVQMRKEYNELLKKNESLIEQVKGLRKDVRDKETHNIQLDKKGFNTYIRKGNSTIDTLNNDFS